HNSTTVKIDTKAPVSSDNNDHAWHNAAYTVHLAATDAPALNAFNANSSGVATVNYSVDGGATQTVAADNTDVTIPAPAGHANDGLHTIVYWATDNTTYSASGWASGCSSSICGSATDDPALNASNANSSGLSKVEVSIKQDGSSLYWNGSSFSNASETWNVATGAVSWSYSFTPPADGLYTIRSRATDNANNVETS